MQTVAEFFYGYLHFYDYSPYKNADLANQPTNLI